MSQTHHQDVPKSTISGWLVVALIPIMLIVAGLCMWRFIVTAGDRSPELIYLFAFVLIVIGSVISAVGLFALQPNTAVVVTLFGAYVGTVRSPGFHWLNPLCSRSLISLRVRNTQIPQLKVNDLQGNPIEIAAVIVWRVVDAAKAEFDVADYDQYVHMQSESALRHLANSYPYDHGEEGEITLRSGIDAVSETLRKELADRLKFAGVVIDEAWITHLAYAPEIASAMLRRQQAEAVIAARQKIVHGAVSMVELALQDLAKREVIVLDEERKAAMVSNLLVVLCSESEVHPVINAGTLYQ